MKSILVLLLLASATFAGCFGGKDAGETLSDSTIPTDATGVDATPSPTDTGEPPVVPKYHGHDYWGGRQEVYLFSDFAVDLGQDPMEETVVRDNTVVVGYREFDTRMDGDDSGSSDKADTVFQGTEALIVKIAWSPNENIKGLTFNYKPANTPRFQSMPDIKNGQEYRIPLARGWADMAHQLSLSRWRFSLEAFDPSVAALPAKTYVAQGEAKVTMRAINGGESFLDPPHPYFFLDREERYAGEINRTVNSRVVNTSIQQVSNGDPLSGWKAPAPHIIPWDSNLVRAWLFYNYTGALSGVQHELGLSYTDASGTEVKYAKAVETGTGRAYYEIPIGAHQADGPYAASSDWTWGVYPIVNGERNFGGEFEGTIHILLQAKGTSDPASMEG